MGMEGIAMRIAMAGLLVLATVGQAGAFGTVNAFGQKGEHERITRAALKPLGWEAESLDEIAGKKRRFGAVGAPDNPARGLLTTAEAHCDGGDYLPLPGYPQSEAAAKAALTKCRDWIARHVREAVEDAGALLDANGRIRGSQIPMLVSCTYLGTKGRAKCNVLEALGTALHAAQDFYAHSNWTDRPVAEAVAPDNPPGLGKDGAAPWLSTVSPVAFPDGLISGCFEGLPESLFCKGRVKHGDLNKDTGEIDPETGATGKSGTKRGKVSGNFGHAVGGAIAETRRVWAEFGQLVRTKYGQARGDRIVCAIRRDRPTRTCP